MLHQARHQPSIVGLTRLWLLFLLLVPVGCDQATAPTSDSEASIAERTNRILLLEDQLERIAQLARLIQGLPQTSEAAHAAIQGYEKVLIDRGDIELVLIADWWAGFDADGALVWSQAAWLARHPRIKQTVTRSIARQDPQRAVDEF